LCREALILVFFPTFASAASTGLTTVPLFLAKVLILRRFAVVILFTMALGLAFTVLFMTPVLAMFGPGYTGSARSHHMVITDETTVFEIIRDTVQRNAAFRFLLVSAITFALVVRSLASAHQVFRNMKCVSRGLQR
jgi:hypothetical protein